MTGAKLARGGNRFLGKRNDVLIYTLRGLSGLKVPDLTADFRRKGALLLLLLRDVGRSVAGLKMTTSTSPLL